MRTYFLAVYVPAGSRETLKQALFDAGAGRIGNYSCCAWETRGVGQFKPEAGSQPALGQVGQVETVEEYKVEMLVAEDVLEDTLAALSKAHPYETPAFHVFPMHSMDVNPTSGNE